MSERAFFSKCSKAWAQLTPTERLSWDNAIPYFPRTNKLGDPISLSAFNCFCTANINIKTINGSFVNTFTPPTGAERIDTFSDFLIDSSGNSFAFIGSNPASDVNIGYNVKFSGPYRETTVIVPNDWLHVTYFLANTTYPFYRNVFWKNKKGTLQGGLYYWVLIIPTNITNGITYPPQKALVFCQW